MKIEQIREMNTDDIRTEITGLQKELMAMRMGNKIGTIDNPIEIRHKKKTIARMNTVLTEKLAANQD